MEGIQFVKGEDGVPRIKETQSWNRALHFSLESLIKSGTMLPPAISLLAFYTLFFNPLWLVVPLTLANLCFFLYNVLRFELPKFRSFFGLSMNSQGTMMFFLLSLLILDFTQRRTNTILAPPLVLVAFFYILRTFLIVLMRSPVYDWKLATQVNLTVFYQQKALNRSSKFRLLGSVHWCTESAILYSIMVTIIMWEKASASFDAITIAIHRQIAKFMDSLFNTRPLDPKDITKIYSPIYTSSAQENEVFRLIKLEKWRPFLRPRATLFNSTLETAPPYEAISYSWGTSTKTQKLVMNGQTVLVPMATYKALYARSSPWKTRYIWIDYICINQQDNHEKSKQVQIMRHIYSSAERAIVSLDCPFWVAFFAFALLDDIQFLLVGWKLSGRQLTTCVGIERVGLRFHCLDFVLSQPWFSRTWVVQEVTAAESSHVMCGGLLIDFEFLKVLAQIIIQDTDLRLLFQSSPKGPMAFKGLRSLWAMEQISRALKSTPSDGEKSLNASQGDTDHRSLQQGKWGKRLTLSRMLVYELSEFKATDARDRIFSLAGLATDYPNGRQKENKASEQALDSGLAKTEIDLTPDYTQDAQSLYIKVAKYFLNCEHPFYGFSAAGIGNERRIEGLPSWVADWSQQTRWDALDGDENNVKYSASGRREPRVTVLDKTCIIFSVPITKVKITGKPVPFNPKEDRPRQWEGRDLIPEVFSVLHDWHKETYDLALEHCFSAKGSKVEESFWRTIIGNRTFSNESPTLDFKEFYFKWVEVLELAKKSRGSSLSGDRLDEAAGQGDQIRAGEHHVKMLAATGFDRASGQVTHGRKFCVCTDGRMGMVPVETRPGDEIVLFVGANVPVVLRKLSLAERRTHTGNERFREQVLEKMEAKGVIIEDLWHLVGECYVEDCMEGQVFNDRNVRMEHFALV